MTSFKYMGNFKDESSLPTRIQEGAIQFKEPEMKMFALISNGVAFTLLIACIVIIRMFSKSGMNMWGVMTSVVLIVPHEFLHAIWMNGEVYMYTNFKQGMAFVVSSADHTKGRFIWMSLFPTLMFGFLPFILFMIHPAWSFFGWLGAFSISMGAGDFCNIYFALTQMPKNALTFISGFHSYWYIPQK